MEVQVVKTIPVKDAIVNMLNFTRSDASKSNLDYYQEYAAARTDLGMVNMVEGVSPSQVIIYPDTQRPVHIDTWQDEVIAMWFDEYGDWFDEEVTRLKERCTQYPEYYQLRFGRYFSL